MTVVKNDIDRRSFLKTIAVGGGGLMIGFSWVSSLAKGTNGEKFSDEPIEINAYLKIDTDGVITIMSPNPEGGQNVKTSMPMIVAEELDADWENVRVEQASLNTDLYTRQFIGGSQGIRQGWDNLRVAGASARYMLLQAAAQTWQVPVEEITTEAGTLYHRKSGRSAGYGEMVTKASEIPIPEEVELKNVSDFRIIGSSRKNVDAEKIVTGQPLFGIDYHREGMLIAMIVHPPAFGMKLKSFDDSEARNMPGIKDIFRIKSLQDDYPRAFFDTVTFTDLIAVVGETTWEVMSAKKALQAEWEPISDTNITVQSWGGDTREETIPAGLESSADHSAKMQEMASTQSKTARQDGDPDSAFSNAFKTIEKTYTAPFLAHNCMEPMNFFADVTSERAELAGPLQKPEFTEEALSARIGMPLDKIDIHMTRLGGGYGRRSYAHWLVEAGVISQKMNTPIKLIYSREDDMTAGIYRPAYQARYRAAIDENNNIAGFHVNAGGVPQSPLYENRFPAGAVDNYLAEEWTVGSNITVGSFRAPSSNFIAGAEQSFLDEIAEAAGKDPIEFRLELLERAKTNPVGERNDYEPERYAGVIELVREKSGWDEGKPNVHRGVAAYYCHNSYAAQVLDMVMENGMPVVQNVYCAVDCGIVINPDAAANLVEGAIVDGIGNALFGSLSFEEGVPNKNNFHQYRMIRHNEAPKNIEVYFVENKIHPTGLGEPAFPPIFGALANALYQATGKRFYNQPFIDELSNA